MTFSATLALPVLGAARTHFAINPGDAIAAQAVLALYKAGRFDPGALHPARAFAGALALIRGAFERWIRTMQSLFDDSVFAVQVGVGSGSAITDWETARAGNGAPILEIVIGNRGDFPIGASWILKQHYEAVERRMPGLARTALAMIGFASGHGLPLWTPWAALDGAMFAYWAGCEDEREYLEMAMGEGDDAGNIDIFTRAQFDAAIPPEVSDPREVLKPGDLQRLARAHSGKDMIRIAQLCLDIRDACRKDRKHVDFDTFIPERMRETAQLHHLAAVRWSRDDPAYRIYDDWANPAFENGDAIEAYGWHEVPIDAGAIKTWFAGMERRFHIAALGQQLLPLIAEKEV